MRTHHPARTRGQVSDISGALTLQLLGKRRPSALCWAPKSLPRWPDPQVSPGLAAESSVSLASERKAAEAEGQRPGTAHLASPPPMAGGAPGLAGLRSEVPAGPLGAGQLGPHGLDAAQDLLLVAHEGDAQGTHVPGKEGGADLGGWDPSRELLTSRLRLWPCSLPSARLPSRGPNTLTGRSYGAPCPGRSNPRQRSGPGSGPCGWSPASLPR